MQFKTARDSNELPGTRLATFDTDSEAGSRSQQEVTLLHESNHPRKRMGRGRLISIDGREKYSHNAETNPESSFSNDQRLTEISLASANSDKTRAVLDGQTKAADRLDHIFASTSDKHLETLGAAMLVVESGDSLRQIAAKAGVHVTQVARAFEAARRADPVELFKARPRTMSIVAKPYDPKGVSMAVYNRPPGESIIPFFQPDRRSNVGVDVFRPILPSTPDTAIEVEWRPPEIVVPSAPVSEPRCYPALDGCAHPIKKWTVIRYGYLTLKCENCSSELDKKYAFSR